MYTEDSLNMSALSVAKQSLFVLLPKKFLTRLPKTDVNFYDSVFFACQSSSFRIDMSKTIPRALHEWDIHQVY